MVFCMCMRVRADATERVHVNACPRMCMNVHVCAYMSMHSKSSSYILHSLVVVRGFERFCNSTSLHGWKYLSTSEMTLRVGWVAVVLASMGVCCYFLEYSCSDFLTSTVQTTQDTSR